MRLILGLAAATFLLTPPASGQLSIELSGTGSDGRAVRLSASLPEPVSAPLLLRAYQVRCAPYCQAVGLFPGGAAGMDQVVIEQQPPSGGQVFQRYFFPSGALSQPGVYEALGLQQAGTGGALTVTRAGFPGLSSPVSLPGGATGAPYSAALAATGGAPPYTFTPEPGFALPAGLSLSSAGQLSGTPSQAFQGDIEVRVTDSTGAYSVRKYALRIGQGLAVATPGLPAGVVGVPYGSVLQAAGGAPPFSWTVESGSLPPGITLASSGLLSGVPGAAGAFSFVAKVTASGGVSATLPLQLMVSAGPAILTPSALPKASVGAAVSIPLEAAGGLGPYQWSLISGSLPSGILLDAAGTLSGTPLAANNVNFTVQARDAAGNTAIQLFTWLTKIGVAIANPNQQPLPTAVAGVPYSQTFAASGGASPYSWDLLSAPAGLSISSAGLLSGTVAAPGAYSFFVRVNDTAGGSDLVPYTLTVLPAVTITTTSLPQARPGQPYNASLAASGGAGNYAWILAAGVLPPGLTLSPSGAISGTPSGSGSYDFIAKVTDSSGGYSFSPFAIRFGESLSIDTASELPPASVGVPYAQTLAASGGSAPYQWTITGGALPPGLTLSQQGVLSGTPSASGVYGFQIQVADQTGAMVTKAFGLVVSAGLVISTNMQLPSAVPNAPYSQTLEASGGTAPYQWIVTGGALPPGLSLSPGGVLSGTPTAAGSYTFQVTVTDAASASTIKQFSILVSNDLTLLSPRTLPMAYSAQPYSFTFQAGGGTAPYTWAVTGGALPSGVQLAAQTGVLSGTPLAAGAYLFTVRVTDSAGTSRTDSFTLLVTTGLAITTDSLPAGGIGAPYSLTLAASGGAPPYAWALTAGGLPPGITLSQQGVLSGTPSSIGLFPFTVRVTDAAAAAAEKAFTLSVQDVLAVSSSSPLPNGSFGVFYTFTFEGRGGSPPYQWRIASGLLPDGVSLTPAGVLAGTPRLGGVFRFTVEVADAGGGKASKEFSWTVSSPLSITTGATLPEAAAGSPYSLVFGLSGGLAPYTWTVLAGAIPPGLTLAPGGILSGAPAAAGTFQFTLKVADAAQAAAQGTFTLVVTAGSQPPRAGVISQVASGGSWKTAITVLNPGSEPAEVRINFFADSGGTLTLPLTVIEATGSTTTAGSSLQRTIPPRGTLIVESEAAGSTILVGWAEVRSAAPVAGFAIFRQKHGSGVDSEGTSPLESAALQSYLQPMDNLSGFSTGIALVNLAPDEPASVTAVLYDERGQEFVRGSINLPPNGHTSFSVTSLFPAAAGKRGFIEFRADRPAGIMGLGLRFQPTLSFTSVPIVRAP